MKIDIKYKDGSTGKVQGIGYRKHFCIHWDGHWVITHIKSGMSIITGIPSINIAFEIIDGIFDMVDNWDFEWPEQMCCNQAEQVRLHLIFVCDVMYKERCYESI